MPTYSAPHYVVSWLFDIVGTDERAVTGLKFGGTGPNIDHQVPDAGMAENLSDAMVTFLDQAPVARASYSRYLGAKVAYVGTDGHYLEDPAEFSVPAPISGATAGVIPQASVVISLRSGQTLGKGNYGRMYIPHSGITSGATPYFAQDRAQINLAAANMIGAVNDVAADAVAGGAVRIYAALAQSAPQARAVTQVATGRIVDTQRRRRNALTEEYVFRNV